MNTVKPACTHVVRNDPEPKAPDDKLLVIAIGIFNTVVPLFFVLFAWAHAAAFVHTLRFSNVIILVTVVLWIQFYVRRYTESFVSTSAYAWLIALVGTAAPLMFRPTADESDFSAGTVMLVCGMALLIYVIRTFNGRFGTSCAKRGMGRDGLYRFVRHPLYLTFILSQYGYVLSHTTLYNICVCMLAIFFQVLRINEEERLLLDDEEFQEYAEQTPWRVIPRVF
jgi:protein-S-isoprenylcysteine O-methyltransferase Ste14